MPEAAYKIVLIVSLFGISCLYTCIYIACSHEYPQNYFIINIETMRIAFVLPYLNQGQYDKLRLKYEVSFCSHSMSLKPGLRKI